jgi:small subunit ribosomal protein S6
MRNYEAFYIVSAQLSDAETQKIVDHFKEIVEKNGGTVNSAGKWETRDLAYEIKGHRNGTYILMLFQAEPTAQKELKRLMSISDDIIRHVILAVEEQ